MIRVAIYALLFTGIACAAEPTLNEKDRAAYLKTQRDLANLNARYQQVEVEYRDIIKKMQSEAASLATAIQKAAEPLSQACAKEAKEFDDKEVACVDPPKKEEKK